MRVIILSLNSSVSELGEQRNESANGNVKILVHKRIEFFRCLKGENYKGQINKSAKNTRKLVEYKKGGGIVT